MNRRDSLKAIGLTAISAGLVLEACKPGKEKIVKVEEEAQPGRQDFEIARDKKLNSYKFFNDHEMATITVLVDIIIPKDDKSGSASEAKVPDFIEFIVKDMPEHQTPMRGGLKWLDLQCLNRFEKTFKDASLSQQIEMVDDIAYPEKVKPGLAQGVAFFNLMRNLTASGFYTTEIGVNDLGYIGNVPNRWEGVPADVLKQYGMEGV
ncbi:gluconate 2-dehydrogenase subunit 3 family protein [Pedobacter hiemivivus]|uniref:Gluconate 2-dehydrogenase subunit 3 family protein n=1 Tax=Pedobacter hiemivivus TaxID=2530454 RepID=A0A4U1GDD0_9SPHI|nr:gluconate 2-dehydrogenase subunit 3 family protein [Pedobacter hiemivivus]TKC62027.1 gluconate 2-dehydrogenase subunit 3 family protein [Pedobacter hiemivivus]